MPISKKMFNGAKLSPKEHISAFLNEHKSVGEGYDSAEIVDETGLDLDKVSKNLEELVSEKKIERVRYRGSFYYRSI